MRKEENAQEAKYICIQIAGISGWRNSAFWATKLQVNCNTHPTRAVILHLPKTSLSPKDHLA